jgi:protein-disulfide isomerase
MSRLSRPLGEKDHIIGPRDAPVTLVEYGDYECPHCGKAYPIVEAVRHRMGDTLRFAYRHFPLTQIHPHAYHAAEMAEAAGTMGKFWEMHSLLFRNQDALEAHNLIEYAERVGISPQRASEVLENNLFDAAVREHFMSGVRSGVNGTPTFFINGVRHDGAWDEESLLLALQQAEMAGHTG